MTVSEYALIDVLESLETGKRPKGGAIDNGVPSLGAEHVSVDGTLKLGSMKFVPEDFYLGMRKGRLCIGDVLVVKDGATTGRVGIVDESFPFERACVNEHLFLLRANQTRLEPRYLYFYLRSRRGQAQLMSDFRGAAQGGISREIGTKIAVPLPSLVLQKQIADRISGAEGILRLRRAAHAITALLGPSIFHKMFGDPQSNPKAWPRATLGDCIHAAQDGPHVSPSYASTGIPFLSTRHVKKGRVEFNDLKYLSLEDAEIQWRKCKPAKGDVLYTKGGTTGIAAAIDFDQEVAVWVHVALLKTNHSKAHPLWLEHMLNSEFCYLQSQELTHGIANRDLGLKRMVNIRCYLPPLQEQLEFVGAMSALRAIEQRQRQALAGSKNLRDAMLSKAFD